MHGSQIHLLPLAVCVHPRVSGLQEFAPHAVSSATVHSTHVPPSHTPLPAMCVQSSFPTHGAHAFVPSSHRGAVASVHVAFSRHATHTWASVSQSDVAPSHAIASVTVHSTHS